jgi:rhomboid protease GluP
MYFYLRVVSGMKEIENTIITILNRDYNFIIVEFNITSEPGVIWGLERETEANGRDVVLFMKNEKIIPGCQAISAAIREKYKNLFGINIHLVAVGDYLRQEEKSLIRYSSYFTDITVNVIYLDRSEGKIVYSDSDSNGISELINYILHQSNRLKNSEKSKNKSLITNILVFLNVVIFLLSAYLSGNIFDIDGRILVLLGAKYNQLIMEGEYYRLVTAMFLHGGLIHIGFNMYALKSLGPFIESIFGKVKYVIIYFIGGIASSLFSYWFSDAISVGASGAIFALLGSALVYSIKLKNKIGRDFLSNIAQVIVVNLILGFTISNIDNFGHIGGLIGGITISLILWRKQ